MKIVLIKPKWFIRGGIYRFVNNIRFTPLNLGIIAALSPGHEVTIVDGDWDNIPYDEKYDLVGITVTTFTSEQAFEIAGKFRAKGAKVVIGGVHACLLPEECLAHADSIVTGEAEYVWPRILKDAERNELKKIYKDDKIVDMNDIPLPQRDLLNEMSWFTCVQITRGCPNSCRYCYLPNVPWKSYRKRSIDQVYEELKNIKQQVIFFVDDNLFADLDYAQELFDRIAPLKKIWSIQAPTTIADNKALLDKMERSGCFNVQMGFQTVNPKSLEWASIKQNRVEKYKNIVATLHEHNILVTAFIIFGFDTDDKNIFQMTVDMIKDIDLDDAHLYILTPYPGTELYEQFKKEGRLLDNKDRSNFGWANAVFKPRLMTAEELETGVKQAYQQLHRHFTRQLPGRIFKRLPWLIRHPSLLYTLVSGGLGKKNTAKKLA
jgi:radical SAM superfamily enzyme YgiQ (UPF0313 family)